MADLSDRNIRHRDIIPPAKLEAVWPVVVGVGAIGSQVATMLAHIGVPRLTIIDFDDVSVENLGPQGYREDDLGKKKVEALALTLVGINHGLEVHTFNQKFDPVMLPSGKIAVFMCVDDMDARAQIFRDCAEEPFLVDGRMSAELMRILTITDPASRAHYKTTIFSQLEAHRESCTTKSTIYCANIAAGLLVGQFTKWLRGFPLSYDFEFNILSMEFADASLAPNAA